MVTERKYVDVNVFVYWLASHPKFGEKALKWIQAIERGVKGEYVTSALTIYEVIVVLAGLMNVNLRDSKLVSTVTEALTSLPGLEIVPLTLEDALKATELMQSYNLDYEDALHLATALRVKAKVIISNDSDFDKTPLRRVF